MKKWILILSVIAYTQMVVGADDNLRYLDLSLSEDVLDGLGLSEGLDFNKRYSDAAQGAQPPENEELPDLMQTPLQTALNEALVSAPLDMRAIVAAGADLARTAPVMQAPLSSQQDQPTLFAIPDATTAEAVQAAQAAAVQEYIEDIEEDEEDVESAQADQAQAAVIPAKPRKKNAQGKYLCTWKDCFKVFTIEKHFEGHMRTHTGDKPVKCDQCNKRLASNRSLQQHKLACSKLSHNDTSNKKPYICEKICTNVSTGEQYACGRSYTTQANLKQHHQRVHEKVRFECPHCPKSYNAKRSLQDHIKREHSQ